MRRSLTSLVPVAGLWPVAGVLVTALLLADETRAQSALGENADQRSASTFAETFAPLTESQRRLRSAAILKSGKDISYQDVLRDPDNIALNLAYARTQIRRLDLLGASATLERVLILVPGHLGARILYGVTLYRLGNDLAAEKHLRLVLKFKLPQRLRKEIGIYLTDISYRKRQTKKQLILHAGVQYDTNRSAGPAGDQLETNFGIQPAGRQSKASGDWSSVLIGRLKIDHDLRMARRHRIFATFNWFRVDQLRLDRFSFEFAELAGGGIIDFGNWSLKPELFFRFARLSHETLSRSVGFRLTARTSLDTTKDLWSWASVEALSFNGPHESPGLRRRAGADWRLGLRGRYRYSTTRRATATLELGNYAAAADHFSFTEGHLYLDHEWRLGQGQFLLTHLGYRYRSYRGRNPLEGPGGNRHDHRVRARMLYGVPVLTLYRDLPQSFDRTAITLMVEMTANRSNIRNYDTTNWRFALGLIKRFDF